MSKKFAALLLISALFVTISNPAFSLENNIIEIDSPSPEYLEWLKSPDLFTGGLIPSPVDNSNLWKNPPQSREKFSVKNTLPAKYDLREHNRVPAIRNQNPWGACWSFAAIASLETSYINLYPDNQNINLSEMLIAYFAYGDKREGKSYSLHYKNEDILEQGGNYYQAAALLARLGTVNENILPYPTGNKSYTAPDKLPEEYIKTGIGLKESYEIGLLSGDEIIDTVKNLIINNGAIYAVYYSNPYNYGYYTPAKSGVSVLTTSYFNNQTDNKGKPRTPNHAISIIGWDDNFSRDNFGSMKPEKDGAWLVRNSWGNWANNGGYFWMSYEQYIQDVTMFIADKMPENLKHYGHDDLGRIAGFSSKWSASIFKNESQDEILQYTGFNARDNNTDYKIYIYDLGTDKPSSPVDGVLLASKDNFTPYAGYHTENFSSEHVRLKVGHYFSVVMNTNTGIGTEATYELKAVVNPEESYYSYDGQNWNDLYNIRGDYKHNACIKAFTVPAPKIEIDDINLPDAVINQEYNVKLSATGNEPITWTLAEGSSLPDSLNLSSDGTISGIPEKSGEFNFTVIASNSDGTASKDFTINIKDVQPVEIITPANLDPGTAGKKYNLTLEAEGNNITWELISGDLPDGLKFDSKKGTLSGKIREEGKFSFTIKASQAEYIYSTKIFYLSVYTAPKISVKNLPSAAVNKEYSAKVDFTGSALTGATCDNLPAGLSIQVVSGECVISGVPTESGKKSINLTITNQGGSVTKKLSLAVFGIEKASIPEGTTGKKYKGSITVSGIKAGSWAISSGDLPPGLSLSKGKISGKPTHYGSFDFTVKVSAGEFFVEESYTIKIYPADPVFMTKSLPKHKIYESYNEQVELKSDGGAEITWSADFPEKLKGLEIDSSTGIISGTPTHVFKGNVPVTATNNFGKSTTKNVKITITADKPKVIAAPLPAAKVGEKYNFTLQASGSPILIWSGKLPAGLEIDESGDITGTPEKSGKFKFSVKVENEGGSKTKKFTLVVNEADSTSDKNFAESDSDSQESESLAQNNNDSESESESQNESISQEFTGNNLILDSAALSLVSNDDFMIAAVLPDIKVDESGIYEFTISLDKSVPENAKLIWHSFPGGQISDSEDDNTAIFFNEDGQEIYNVPEDFCVTVSAWFEPGKIYKPVIAVKK